MLAPTHALAPQIAAAVEEERIAINARRLRVVAPALLVVHVGCLLYFWPTGDGAVRLWLTGIARVHAIMLVVTFVLLALAYAPPQAPWAAAPRRHVGEFLLCAYGAVGTAISFNTHLIGFNVIAFTISLLMVAAAVQTTLRTSAVVYAASTLALVVGVLAVEPASPARYGAIGNAVVIAVVAFMVSRTFHASMVREVVARLELAALNRDLERRVDEQVAEIVARAGEIEQLNQLLNAQVRERSRELATALARLATAELGTSAVEPGTVIGDRVELQRILGVGGMGVVYAGHDRVTGQDVAVKLIQAHRRELDILYRFLDEARAAASVRHPAIVRVLHVDVADGGYLYQVLELVEGEALESRLERDGILSTDLVLRLGAVVADALAAAHAADVVHRDITPSNIMLTPAEPGAKLLDFGLAKLRSEVDPRRTAHSDIIGTPAFLAPEQVTSPGAVTGAADVYALGCTLFLCLAGVPPFAASTAEQWLHAHVHEPVPHVGSRLPSVDPRLTAIIAACLAKQPAARPSAAELAARLCGLADAAGLPSLEVLEQRRVAAELGRPAVSAPAGAVAAPRRTAVTIPLGAAVERSTAVVRGGHGARDQHARGPARRA
jgi:eukaryotic-like serine/threonine-protein kinase